METAVTFQDSVWLDDQQSDGLQITFLWADPNVSYNIIAPDGTTYDNNSSEYSIHVNYNLSQFTFPKVSDKVCI